MLKRGVCRYTQRYLIASFVSTIGFLGLHVLVDVLRMVLVEAEVAFVATASTAIGADKSNEPKRHAIHNPEVPPTL